MEYKDFELSEEERRKIFESAYPELAHLTSQSSLEERRTAIQNLNTRLGISLDSGLPTE
jgi:hypothetical protein